MDPTLLAPPGAILLLTVGTDGEGEGNFLVAGTHSRKKSLLKKKAPRPRDRERGRVIS